MFVTFEIPIADVRPFVGSETARLAVPGWPTPLVDAEFVRSVGPVRERRLGGLSPWAGEGYYANAGRAIRFPRGFGQWPYCDETRTTRLHCLFRKFFCDGGAVSRVELGFGPRDRFDKAELAAPNELLALVARCLAIPVEVPCEDGSLSACELVRAGPPLARHLLRSTTSSADALALENWWLKALRPVLVITLHDSEIDRVPKTARRISLNASGAVAYHLVAGHNGVTAPVWILPWHERGERDLIRRVRLHLFRLHAEREVLKWVLSAASQGRLANASSADGWDRLQRYLGTTLPLLERGTLYGIKAGEELRSALGLGDLVNPGDRESLLARAEGMRQTVRRKVEEAPAERHPQPIFFLGDQTIVTGSEIKMEDKSIRVGDIHGSFKGAIGSDIDITESFQQIEESSSSSDVKDTLKALVEAVQAMNVDLGEEQKAVAKRDLEGIVQEASAEAPRRTILEALADGLVQTAKTVGEVGIPVIKLVTKLLVIFG